MRKYLIISTFILMILYTQCSKASEIYGDWAKSSIQNAINNLIISDDPNRDYYSPITRLEIAEIISADYFNIKGNLPFLSNDTFIDVDNECIDVVATLGIMNGYGDGTFLPNNTTSRQEMAKILLTYQSVITDSPIVFSSNYSLPITDFDSLSDWAKPYVSASIEQGLLKGYEDGSFGGLNPVSWQEAIVMIDRVSDYQTTPIIDQLSTEFDMQVELVDESAIISWQKIHNSPHNITITEQRLSHYEGDIPPNVPINLLFNDETSYILHVNPNKKYTFRISCENKYFEKDIYTKPVEYNDKDEIFSTYPTTEEVAEVVMVEITVPIWTIVENQKIASSTTLKIHKSISDKVLLIFKEIFNGEEKFPIKDVGGYSWRGGTSEHNGGTAIDINSNENYCIYNDGTTIGSHWKPYEDPYSITPYGDVVRAFEKYGFTWGGDSWSNPKDYMHFSYLGT